MSFKSMFQEMKEEIGSISRKGRSRSMNSRRNNGPSMAAVAAEEVEVALEQSCWANMPSELLRDVLVRIEESEGSWPPRKDVVACAGVCRSWREIMKEIVKLPEISGHITFPISLKQPGPRDFPLQCFIKRDRTTQTYRLYLGLTQALTDNGKFLLASRKCRRTTCTDYLISLDADNMSKGSGTYVGKLRSNFLGTKFTVYDAQPPHAGAMVTRSRSTCMVDSKQISPKVPAGNYPVAHISFELNVLGSREKELIGEVNILRLQLEISAAQRAKCSWLKDGDRCSKFFYDVIRTRQHRNNLSQLLDVEGNLVGEPSKIQGEAVRGPRRMQSVMDSIPALVVEPGGEALTQEELLINGLDSFSSVPFFRSKLSIADYTSAYFSGHKGEKLVLRNKAPRWHEQLQCWCLNFRGRVTVASVKNFQLVASEENGPASQEQDKVILQFGKVGKDLFTMDYQYPVSAFQAFAICLSSFDTKIACE
ncbi:putative tubby-like F-box protein 8 [Iris pallida]|uniref:Tubby-like F-box protein n=1 Tax=Iris pallida TaxID=29817 RepID=A0AAX6FEQ3_IRIPA|nr:putative tubby-like F-box protein 8 [Iris pallida]